MGEGPSCCSAMSERDEELVVYDEKQKQGRKADYLYREGEPDVKVAININDLRWHADNLKDWEEMQDSLFQMLSKEKKRKKKRIEVNRVEIHQNNLEDPYFLPKQNAFYLGEWAKDPAFGENVPYGIGKLYQKDLISEGVFKSYQNNQQPTSNQPQLQLQPYQEEDIPQENKLDNLMNGGGSNPDKYDFKSILVKLNGRGAIYNKEFEMHGDFVDGILNGKGTLKYIKEEYEYIGGWKNGRKHGKGKEITRQTEYEGYFKEDQREGRGTQIFYGTMKKNHAREAEEEKFKKKMLDDGDEIKKEVESKIQQRKKQQKKIKKALQDFPYPLELNFQSMLFDVHLSMERENKKIFLQEYTGEFKENKMHGKGKYVWSNGKMYDGNWKDGLMEGQGQFIWMDGSLYQGYYSNDVRHGKGLMIWDVRRRYRGDWAYGVRHGYGEAIEVDENWNLVVKGAIWEQDKIKEIKFEKRIRLEE